MTQTQHKVAVRLSMDGALEVKQGLRDVGEAGNREMGKLAHGAQVAQRAFSLLGPVLAGISVGALAAFTKNAIDVVGGLGELADQVGVSTDALQALSLASTQAGISGEELQRGLAALTRKIADAAAGEQTAEQAFARLGIAFRNTEGQARPTEAVLLDIAERLREFETPAERASVVTSMFGDRIGQKLIPLLSQGREGLIGMTAEALRFGTIASPELIAKADEAADKVAALTASFSAFANNMVANVAPAIVSVIDGLNRLIFGLSTAERRAQLDLQITAAQSRIEHLQQGGAGISPGRRGSIRSGLVNTAQGQTGETPESLLAQERMRLEELQREMAALNHREQELRTQAERILNPAGGTAGALPATTVTAPRGGAAPRAAALGRDPFADTLREQQALLRSNETAYERYQRQLEELAALQDRLNEAEQQGVEINGTRVRALSTEELTRATERFANELERAEKQTQRTDRMGVQMGMSFSSAFEDAILDGKKFSEILQSLERDIARIIIRTAVTGPAADIISAGVRGGMNSLMGSFSSPSVPTSSPGVAASASGPLYSANGNAFIGGNVIPFANGGVVSSPTMFPMARGMGLMGEAGPEAIMPLQRGADGKLGVRAGGGGQSGVVINQTITIDARGADPAVDQKIRAAIQIATKQAQVEMLDAINRGGNVAKAVGRR
jgi:lambda family phage tail tape measure protein